MKGIMDRKMLSERDICTKYITPVIERAGWNIKMQMLETSFAKSNNLLNKLKEAVK